ncbi:MAG: MaoC family dehydratase [Desulfotomaculaceae bacterium]
MLNDNRENRRELKSITRVISQPVINSYAAAVNDFNPIHVDEEYGKKSMFGSTTAHGFLMVGYLATMLKENFGPNWFTRSKFEVRFRRPAKPGDSLTMGGVVEGFTEDTAECRIWVRNQLNEEIISGSARVPIKRGDSNASMG